MMLVNMASSLERVIPVKADVTTSKPLELLHLDLFGPTQVASIGGMIYALLLSMIILDLLGSFS